MASEPLLLIPGPGETRDVFLPQIATFAGRVACVVARTGRYQDIRMEAGAILGEAPARFSLAGHSFGCSLALEIMRRAPERVSRLALISARAGLAENEERERRLTLVQLAEEEGLDSVHKALWPTLVHPDKVDNARLEGISRRMLEATGVNRFVIQQRAVANRMGFWGLLPAIRIPTAIIVGEQDMVAPKNASTAIQAAIRGAELTVALRCGHLATLEQPHAVNGAMDRWLGRAPARGKADDAPDSLEPLPE